MVAGGWVGRRAQAAFPALFARILAVKKEHTFTTYEATSYLLFITNCFAVRPA